MGRGRATLSRVIRSDSSTTRGVFSSRAPSLWVVILAVVGLMIGLTSPALAETPTEVVEGSSDSSVFVARSRDDVDAEVFAEALASARSAGLNLLIVVPAEPQPDARSFALRVRQAGEEVDAVLLVDVDGLIYTSVGEDYSDAASRAGEAAQSGLAPGRAASAFVHELTVELVVEQPALFAKLTNGAVLLMVILAVAVFLEVLWTQFRKWFVAKRQGRIDQGRIDQGRTDQGGSPAN